MEESRKKRDWPWKRIERRVMILVFVRDGWMDSMTVYIWQYELLMCNQFSLFTCVCYIYTQFALYTCSTLRRRFWTDTCVRVVMTTSLPQCCFWSIDAASISAICEHRFHVNCSRLQRVRFSSDTSLFGVECKTSIDCDTMSAITYAFRMHRRQLFRVSYSLLSEPSLSTSAVRASDSSRNVSVWSVVGLSLFLWWTTLSTQRQIEEDAGEDENDDAQGSSREKWDEYTCLMG